jgi:hypothetical protein
MRSVQMSRASQYGTRESLTAEEFARRASGDEGSRDRAVNQETILRNEFGVRTFGYTSFVVDPANGQMPAMTVAGRARAANRDAGTFGPGPFNDFEDFTLYDRCVTRGVVGSILPVFRSILQLDVPAWGLRSSSTWAARAVTSRGTRW